MNTVTKAAKSFVRGVVKNVIMNGWSRPMLNNVYQGLSPAQRERFHRAFANQYRQCKSAGVDGAWNVRFDGKTIMMPLARDTFWLDWDLAISIIGHDMEVKETYDALLQSSERPELFIDIGANFGTHSLLFLVTNVETITVEPNSACHQYFLRVCKTNAVVPRLEPVALGEQEGAVELSYPEGETWLGSTSSDVVKTLSSHKKMITATVQQKCLDSYCASISSKRTLIKIDAEGNEAGVLLGAAKTLAENKPKIIFECWGSSDRVKLFKLLSSFRYGILSLPWSPGKFQAALTEKEFLASTGANFIALADHAPSI